MATTKVAYAASAALTISANSLASSSSLVAGRQSSIVDNVTTTLYDDVLLSGKVKAGTSPTAGVAEVWAWGLMNDTPTYPDVLGASDAAATFTSRMILGMACVLVATLPIEATTGYTQHMGPRSLAACFGGVLPRKWGIFLTHNTVAALDASAGASFSFDGITYTTA